MDLWLKTECIRCLRQFLYASEEDLYKLVGFFAEKISESSESGRAADHINISARRNPREDNFRSSFEDSMDELDDAGVACDYSKVETKLNDLRLETQAPETAGTRAGVPIGQASETCLYPKEMDVTAAGDESSSRMEGFCKDEENCILNEKDSDKGQVDAGKVSFGNEETAPHVSGGHMSVVKQKVTLTKKKKGLFICF